MSKVKELYIALRDDPDLDIPEGETRESAAWNETSQRMRQHKTNSKALALAAEVSESTAVEKLWDFNSNQNTFQNSSLESLDNILLFLEKAPRGTPEEEAARRAYTKAVKEIHPDKASNQDKDSEEKKFHTEQFKDLEKLYKRNGKMSELMQKVLEQRKKTISNDLGEHQERASYLKDPSTSYSRKS